jgi:hypothetical protein
MSHYKHRLLLTLLELLCGRPTELSDTLHFVVRWQCYYNYLVDEYSSPIISQFILEQEPANLVGALVEYLGNNHQIVIDIVYEVCLALEE